MANCGLRIPSSEFRIRMCVATTNAPSSALTAVAASIAQPPAATTRGASKNNPTASAGTPIVHPANTIACSAGSRI